MQLKAGEPVVNMDMQRTLNFFERHYDPDASIENAMTWEEFTSELDKRINSMFDEKESYILFEESEDAFFLRHITNNHVSGQYFNQ